MNKLIIILSVLLSATLVQAQNETRLPADNVTIGKPTGFNPQFQFRGTTNKIRANRGTGNLEFSHDGTSFSVIGPAGGSNPNVNTYTTTQVLTATNGIVLLDATSGAFTVTLPTAVGNTGKTIKLTRTDSTLANVITIACTGGETVGGTSTKPMHTINETYEVVSNGTNWIILAHRADTDWIDAGVFINFYTFTITSGNATLAATYTNNGNTYVVAKTVAAGVTLVTRGPADPLASGTLTKTAGTGDATLTFSAFTGAPYNVTATTTAPTLTGNNTENYYKYKRKGRFIHVWAKFFGASAGIIGSGDYIWPMLPNITIDTAIHPLVTSATPAQSINSQISARFTDFHPAIGGRILAAGDGAAHHSVQMWAPYTSTTYRVFGEYTNTDGLYSPGSSYSEASNVRTLYHFQFEAAVSGWEP